MSPRPYGRRRPPWWPENEPFPPRGRPPWAGGRPFHYRIAAGLAAIVALAVAAGTLAAWLAGTAAGSNPAPRAVRVLAALVLLVAFGGVVATVRRFGRIAQPVGDLIEAARRIEGGDYTARIPEPGSADLRQVARAFNAMSARLDSTETARRTFLADVAHELRTPLAVIRGQAEGIADGVYAADAEHLAPILEATKTLQTLVDDLRTLTLSESGALHLNKEPTDLGALIADVAGAYQPQAARAEIELTTDLPEVPSVNVDPVRIRAVLSNLVLNALAHTPPKGRVNVAVESTASGVEVRVEDTGPGIPEAIRPHVFDRFVKGPDSRGSGLGLAIARDLVLAHGGTISAGNRPQGGAVFRFSLRT